MINKKPILLIDGMNTAYRAFYSHGKLTTSTGRSISMIYGFLQIVGSLKKLFRPHKLIVVWDGKKSKNRLAIHPEYKAHRSKVGMDVEDFYKQRDRVQKMLNRLGIPQVHHEDVEADDFICKYTKEYHAKYSRKIIIVSGDKDFGQLVSKKVNLYVPSKNKVYNPINFIKDHGHTPEQVVDYLCLTGDKSDNIPGYGGIGEKRAAEFLTRHSSIELYLNSNRNDKLDKKKLLQVYEKNRRLIDLNFYVDNYLKDIPITYFRGNKSPEYNEDKFVTLCDKFEIRTFKQDNFLTLFK